MEYKRAIESGIIEIWKEDKLIGQFYPVDELWKRKVYLTISSNNSNKKQPNHLKVSGE